MPTRLSTESCTGEGDNRGLTFARGWSLQSEFLIERGCGDEPSAGSSRTSRRCRLRAFPQCTGGHARVAGWGVASRSWLCPMKECAYKRRTPRAEKARALAPASLEPLSLAQRSVDRRPPTCPVPEHSLRSSADCVTCAAIRSFNDRHPRCGVGRIRTTHAIPAHATTVTSTQCTHSIPKTHSNWLVRSVWVEGGAGHPQN